MFSIMIFKWEYPLMILILLKDLKKMLVWTLIILVKKYESSIQGINKKNLSKIAKRQGKD